MEQTKQETVSVISYAKALALSLILTMVLILIFALILKFTNLSDGVIAPVNLVIKAISIAAGTIVLTKGKRGGLIKGLILGLTFTILAFIIFSIMAGRFVFGTGLLLDVGFGALVGAIVGIISVNFNK